MLQLTHGCGGLLKVWVRPFIPVEGDVTSYQWTNSNGIEMEQPMPHYALAGIEATKKVISTFIDENLHGYLRSHLDPKDFLVWGIFRLGLKRAKVENVRLLICLSYRRVPSANTV